MRGQLYLVFLCLVFLICYKPGKPYRCGVRIGKIHAPSFQLPSFDALLRHWAGGGGGGDGRGGGGGGGRGGGGGDDDDRGGGDELFHDVPFWRDMLGICADAECVLALERKIFIFVTVIIVLYHI